MKQYNVLLLLFLSACSAEDVLPDVGPYGCVQYGSCNGDMYRGDCAAMGLPSTYGVEATCKQPVRVISGECRPRWHGTENCVHAGALLCCNR